MSEKPTVQMHIYGTNRELLEMKGCDLRGFHCIDVSSSDELERLVLQGQCQMLLIACASPTRGLLRNLSQAAENGSVEILLLVSPSQFSQCRELAPKLFILPTDLTVAVMSSVLQHLRTLCLAANRAQSSIDKLNHELSDIKIINRAKILLVTNLHMSEVQAHKYIERTAMDRCVKKREIAETIIRTYEF